MKRNVPLFSVAIVCFQQYQHLQKCIDSVLKQNYSNVELILCDDDSCDFDSTKIEQYIQKHKDENIRNVVIHKQPKNVKQVLNYQTALELAKGEYLVFLRGTDQLNEINTLLKIACYMKEHSLQFVATRGQGIDTNGNGTDEVIPHQHRFLAMEDTDITQQTELIATHLGSTYMFFSAVFWKREFLNDLGQFDKSYSYTYDWPIWLKLCQRHERIPCYDLITIRFLDDRRPSDVDYVKQGLKKHTYEEWIRILKEVSKAEFIHWSIVKKVRIKYLIDGINAQIVKERSWWNWSLFQKNVWRMKNLPFLLISNMYGFTQRGKRYINYDLNFKIMFLMIFLVLFNIRIFGIEESKYIWCAVFICMLLSMCLKFIYVLFSFIYVSVSSHRRKEKNE